MLRRALRARDTRISQEARHLWADPLKIAGGAKLFASPAEESGRTFALGQVRTSMRLHGTSRVIPMVRSDCGPYGGLRAFDGSKERETAHLETQLGTARDFLNSNVPAIAVEYYYLAFAGVWALEAT